MPLITQRTVLAGKQEVTAGTAIALTSGTDGIINAFDVVVDADIPYNKRMSYGAFGVLNGVTGTRSGTLKFKVEAYGSGTPLTAPAWANVLFPSCGMSVTSGVATHISAYTSQKTATLGIYEDGFIKKLYGAMGTWTFNGEDGKVPYFEFDYKGLWAAPTDGAMFTPQFTTIIPPAFQGATLTIGSYTPTASKISIKQGCEVTLREDMTNATGFIAAVITGREVTGTLDPELTSVASYDQFGTWLGGSTAALTCEVGATGNGVEIQCPALQYTGIKEGSRTGKRISNLEWIAAQNSSSTDSDLTITFF